MKNIQVVRLISKIGVLFANCNGEYHNDERDFISGVLDECVKNGIIAKEETQSFDSQKVDYAVIVKETTEFLAQYAPSQQKQIIHEINSFIQGVIEADGTIAPEEKVLFDKWQQDVVVK